MHMYVDHSALNNLFLIIPSAPTTPQPRSPQSLLQATHLALQLSAPVTKQLCIRLPATSPAGATASQVEALFFSYTHVRCSVTRLPLLACLALDEQDIKAIQQAARAALGLVITDVDSLTEQVPASGTITIAEPTSQFPFIGNVLANFKRTAATWQMSAGSVPAPEDPAVDAIAEADTEDTPQRFVISYASESEGTVQSSYSDFKRMGLILHEDLPREEVEEHAA